MPHRRVALCVFEKYFNPRPLLLTLLSSSPIVIGVVDNPTQVQKFRWWIWSHSPFGEPWWSKSVQMMMSRCHSFPLTMCPCAFVFVMTAVCGLLVCLVALTDSVHHPYCCSFLTCSGEEPFTVIPLTPTLFTASHPTDFTCVGALAIANALEEIDADLLSWWVAERQTPSGGLNGRPEKKPDVCHGGCPVDPVVSSCFLERGHPPLLRATPLTGTAGVLLLVGCQCPEHAGAPALD